MKCAGLAALVVMTIPLFGSGRTVAIRDVSVFDSATKTFVVRQTVLIQGERFDLVQNSSSTRIPASAEVLDGRGRFLIPGLIDAHVHPSHVLFRAAMTGDEVLPFYLANGVTSIRSAGDFVVPEKLLQRWAVENPTVAPRVFMASPLLSDAPPIHPDIGWHLADSAAVPKFVDDMVRWGVVTLKIYANCSPQVGRTIIAEGHKRRLMVTGHLASYPAEQAIEDGIDAIEHIESVADSLLKVRGDRHSLDLSLAGPLIRKIAERRVFVDPTLMVFWGTLFFVDQPEVITHPDNLHMPGRLRSYWTADGKTRLADYSSGPLKQRQVTFAKYQELVGILYRAGVRILVGTDAPEPQVPPGYSLHHEMELLVQSGMPPAEVLYSATSWNAAALNQDKRLGRIQPGYLADAVLLSANPLDDIRNTRKIVRVIKSGMILHPDQIMHAVSLRSSWAEATQAGKIRQP